MDKKELVDKIRCALTHNLRVCNDCNKCDGNDFVEIRLNLINELKQELLKENP